MWTDPPDDLFEDDSERPPSKSQLKRDSEALKDLGSELMELSADQLNKLELPPELLEAVRIGQGITAHGGLRRQKKWIGKLLRNMDAEPIRERLAELTNASVGATRLLHALENWRDRMIADGDVAVNAFVAEHPGADRQKLRQLVRDARRELNEDAPRRAARQLFRTLRETVDAGED